MSGVVAYMPWQLDSGQARLRHDGDEQVSLPSKCLAPIVLVHPNGNPAAYIAASGFGR